MNIRVEIAKIAIQRLHGIPLDPKQQADVEAWARGQSSDCRKHVSLLLDDTNRNTCDPVKTAAIVIDFVEHAEARKKHHDSRTKRLLRDAAACTGDADTKSLLLAVADNIIRNSDLLAELADELVEAVDDGDSSEVTDLKEKFLEEARSLMEK
jgi:hypothetical protein